MEAKHTATPWEQSTTHKLEAWAGSGMDRGMVFKANSPETAAFIVCACNAHDDLVKALQDFVSLMISPASPMRAKALEGQIEIARDALAKANA